MVCLVLLLLLMPLTAPAQEQSELLEILELLKEAQIEFQMGLSKLKQGREQSQAALIGLQMGYAQLATGLSISNAAVGSLMQQSQSLRDTLSGVLDDLDAADEHIKIIEGVLIVGGIVVCVGVGAGIVIAIVK